MELRSTGTGEQYRHEFKYICSEAQLAVLSVRLKGILKRDIHAGENGTYLIKSLYFDDFHDRCFWENEDGINIREKFRIRIYDNRTDRISLECKRKENDKTNKKSCLLTMEQFLYFAYGKGSVALETLPWLARRLYVLLHSEGMRPKVIVSYERTPFVCPEGNVRVTFDRNLASSGQLDGFFSEEYAKRPVLPAGMQLLEVKYDAYLPDPVYHALSLENMQRTSFSKYYLCRKYSL